jgi:phage terminase large subunit
VSSSTLRIETPARLEPLLHPARYKGIHGGRGSGKSHFFAELLIERCMMGATRAVCVREIQRSLEQSVKRLLEDKIEVMGLGGHFRILNTHIEAPNGGIIIFQRMQNHTADSIKTLEVYEVAWVEEAQSLSRRSLDLLRPTIRKAGSEMWFSWNPRDASDPVDSFLRQEPPAGAIVIEANYRHNPWFPAVLREDMEYDKRRDPDRYAHVWLGGYQRQSEARVFSNWKVEEFETPVDARFYFGADWGFAVDPTVLVRCYIEGRTLYVDQEAYKIGCEVDRTPELFDRIDGSRDWPITGDSARPEMQAWSACSPTLLKRGRCRRFSRSCRPRMVGPGCRNQACS